jgi:hypothetical protein
MRDQVKDLVVNRPNVVLQALMDVLDGKQDRIGLAFFLGAATMDYVYDKEKENEPLGKVDPK